MSYTVIITNENGTQVRYGGIDSATPQQAVEEAWHDAFPNRPNINWNYVGVEYHNEVNYQTDLIHRLQERARIRRQIPTRKSVQEGKPDRLANLLDEAADRLSVLEHKVFTLENV